MRIQIPKLDITTNYCLYKKIKDEGFVKITPTFRRHRPVVADGVYYKTYAAAARAYGIAHQTMHERVKSKNFDAHYV